MYQAICMTYDGYWGNLVAGPDNSPAFATKELAIFEIQKVMRLHKDKTAKVRLVCPGREEQVEFHACKIFHGLAVDLTQQNDRDLLEFYIRIYRGQYDRFEAADEKARQELKKTDPKKYAYWQPLTRRTCIPEVEVRLIADGRWEYGTIVCWENDNFASVLNKFGAIKQWPVADCEVYTE